MCFGLFFFLVAAPGKNEDFLSSKSHNMFLQANISCWFQWLALCFVWALHWQRWQLVGYCKYTHKIANNWLLWFGCYDSDDAPSNRSSILFLVKADSWKQCHRTGDGVTGWLTASTPGGLGAPNYFAGCMVERRSEPLPFSTERAVSCSFALRPDWFIFTPSYGGSKKWSWDAWWVTASRLFFSSYASAHVGGQRSQTTKLPKIQRRALRQQ